MITLNVSASLRQEALKRQAEWQTKASLLPTRQGEGNDFLGWINLPEQTGADLLTKVKQTAERLRKLSQTVVVVGIGGSYLGARAVITAMRGELTNKKPDIIYAGHQLSQDYMNDLIHRLDGEDYSVIVISKSGTTIEPAVAFRILKQHCEQKYGKAASKDRIVCITDAHKGALKTLADKEGYETFVIPDNVGGRYSVLTPVGLLPIAVAGLDIDALLAGAKMMHKSVENLDDNNLSYVYALLRNYFIEQGKSVEVMTSFDSRFYYFIEWWKQLFGESEGKNGKGLLPVGLLYTTDLHSMGQYMQEGQRLFFETFISLKRPDTVCKIPFSDNNLDGLNFMAGMELCEVNRQAELGTMLAHQQGGVPTLRIEVDAMDENHLGQLIYFFEYACGLSAYILGVNPFNQPGVESYKKNMFALIKKPGYEDKYEEIQSKIKDL